MLECDGIGMAAKAICRFVLVDFMGESSGEPIRLLGLIYSIASNDDPPIFYVKKCVEVRMQRLEETKKLKEREKS